MHADHRRRIAEILAEHGIEHAHGVEVMRMVRMVSNIYETIVSARMRDEGLSGPRWRLLLHLYMAGQGEPGSLSPTELSRIQNVSKNTISSLLRSLEEQHLIERTLDLEDRRQFQIRLTSRGCDLVRDSTPGHVAFLNQLTDDLSSEELRQLTALLRRLHASLVAHGDVPAAYCLDETNEISLT